MLLSKLEGEEVGTGGGGGTGCVCIGWVPVLIALDVPGALSVYAGTVLVCYGEGCILISMLESNLRMNLGC